MLSSSLVDLFSLLDLNKKENETQGMYDREESEKVSENDEKREQFLTVIHARN